MKKQYLYLIISFCFYLSALGQEKPTNSSTILNQYLTQEHRDQFHKPTNRINQQNLEIKDFYKEKLDSIIEYNYDEGTGTWTKKFIKKTYVYDENFNEVLWVYSNWNTDNNNWTNLMKEESQYDDTTNSMINTQYVWSNNKWNKEIKSVFSYNNDNKLIQELNYKWKYNLKDWLLVEKWDYSYNAQGKPLTDSLYWWYANSQEWALQKKIDYEYINDKELHYIFYTNWDSNTNQWIASKKKWYLYDLQWRLINLSSYEWDDTKDSNWKLTNRKYYGYDDNDYLNEYADINIEPRDDGYVQHELMFETNEYDFSLMFNDILFPNYLNKQELKFHHKLLNTSLGQQNYDTKQEEQYRAVKYYYSPIFVTGTDSYDFISESINIYPNPAKESIHINYPSEHTRTLFELYDINGKKIISSNINKAESIDINTLRKGVYIYRIKFDQYEKVGKLIKK